MACFTQKPSQKGARKSDWSGMTLPLRYAITDGDKNCIGVVCPPFMSSACHLSCAVRLNMRGNSRSHKGLVQRSPSGRTVQAVLQTTLLRFCVLLHCTKALCGAFTVLRCQLSRFLRVTMRLMFQLITHARLDSSLLARTVQAVLQTALLRSCVLLYCSTVLCVVFAVREVPVIAFLACDDASHVRTDYSCAVGAIPQSSCRLSQSAAVNAPSEPFEPSQDNADLNDGEVDSESEDQAEEEESDSDESQEEELSSADVHLADAAKAAITLQQGAVLGSLCKQKGEKWIHEAGDAFAVLDGQPSSSLCSYLESGLKHLENVRGAVDDSIIARLDYGGTQPIVVQCQGDSAGVCSVVGLERRAGVLDHDNGLTLSKRLTPTMVALPHRGILHVKRNTTCCFGYAILFPCKKGVRLTAKTPGVEQGGMPAHSSASSRAMNKHLGELTTAVHSLKRKVEKMQEDTDDAHQTLKSLADQLKPLCQCAKNISQNPPSHSQAQAVSQGPMQQAPFFYMPTPWQQ